MKETESMINAISPCVDKFYKRGVDGLLYVSHASILVSLNGKKFLFDPVLAKPPHLGSWLFYPEMQRDYRMLEVDGVFVSHQHQDHYDVDFLKMLPKSTVIYVVAGRPQFNKMLRDEAISFVELPENQSFDLGSGIFCTGILHEYNGIDAAIAISNGRFTVYHGNDCFVSNEKLKVIRDNHPIINVACIPFAYVHWYPFLLEGVDETWKTAEADRLINRYLNFGLQQIEYFQPEVAIPFGANMFYCDDVSSEHNKAVVSPFDFKNHAVNSAFSLERRIFTLFSGDMIFSNDDRQERRLEVIQEEYSKEDLYRGFGEFLTRVKEEGTGFDPTAIEQIPAHALQDLSFISERLLPVTALPDHQIYISNMDNPSFGIVGIDLKRRLVEKKALIDESLPFHHFRLTDLAYKAYFSQRFSFNEIIASSRFRLIRQPNDYRLDVLKVVNNVL
jgi:L-ascorbate metabolism protein UlaG (beta-lactamase superfamily)